MARPERNNVDYFPLYVDNGRKMFFMETKYGNNGYATWLKLLSELAKANYHYLNLQDNTQLMYLSALCKVTEIELKNIISDLVKLGEFNAKLWTQNIIFSEKFVESVFDAYKKRNNKPVSLLSLVTRLKGLGLLKRGFSVKNGDDNPQSKEEDSKEEDSKEDGFYLDFDFFKDEFKNIWINEFINLKKKKKASVTVRALTSQLNKIKEISKNDYETALKILENSVNAGWSDFYELKTDNSKTHTNGRLNYESDFPTIKNQ